MSRPYLLLLSFFTPYSFTAVTDTLAFVRLRLTEAADFCGNLTNLLFVDAFDNHFSLSWSFYGDPSGNRILNRMGKAQRKAEHAALGLRTITNAHQLQLTLEALRHSGDHVGNQGTHCTSNRTGLLGAIARSKQEHITFLLGFYRAMQFQFKAAFAAFHFNAVTRQLHFNT